MPNDKEETYAPDVIDCAPLRACVCCVVCVCSSSFVLLCVVLRVVLLRSRSARVVHCVLVSLWRARFICVRHCVRR